VLDLEGRNRYGYVMTKTENVVPVLDLVAEAEA